MPGLGVKVYKTVTVPSKSPHFHPVVSLREVRAHAVIRNTLPSLGVMMPELQIVLVSVPVAIRAYENLSA